MERAELIRKITAAAAGVGTDFTLIREGGSYPIFRCGPQNVVIPRHRDINEITAGGNMRDLDEVLGERLVEVTTYTAVCRRSGRWWAISVPELKGVHTQARRLDQAGAMAREAIALMLDADPAAIRVEVLPEVPSTVSRALEARRAARQAEEDAEHATAAAARKLLEDGYTVRDAGTLLHLSPQRVSQIAPARKTGHARATPQERGRAAAG